MPSLLSSLAVLALAASTVSAGTLSVPIVRRADPVPALERRDGTLSLDALNNLTGGGYYAEFGIGSPPQKLSFQLDTGSSDTWVNSVDTDFCHDRNAQAKFGAWCLPQFNPKASSTFKVVERGGFNITYLDQRQISGDYFNDSLTINGKEIKNQQLGLGLESVRQTGLMGLGFSANVATDKKYPTVIDNMLSQGIIDAPVFSLYLNDVDVKSGTILFGGIDSQKYIGNLTTIRLLEDPQSHSNEVTSYSIHLQGLDVDGVKSSTLDAAAILDSGSTLTLLPNSQAQDIFQHFGVQIISGYRIAKLVDCAWRGSKGKDTSFKFKFNGKTIKVPTSEIVLDVFPDDAQKELKKVPQFSGWDKVCLFGIGSVRDYGVSSDSFALLGDTFLRSAYVAYDMANLQLGLAQANVNTDKSNIIEIKKDAKDLPSVAGVAETTSAARHLAPSPAAVAGTLLIAVAAIVSTL